MKINFHSFRFLQMADINDGGTCNNTDWIIVGNDRRHRQQEQQQQPVAIASSIGFELLASYQRPQRYRNNTILASVHVRCVFERSRCVEQSVRARACVCVWRKTRKEATVVDYRAAIQRQLYPKLRPLNDRPVRRKSVNIHTLHEYRRWRKKENRCTSQWGENTPSNPISHCSVARRVFDPSQLVIPLPRWIAAGHCMWHMNLDLIQLCCERLL